MRRRSSKKVNYVVDLTSDHVFAQICVNDIRVALMQQFIYFLDRILRTPYFMGIPAFEWL